MNSPAWIQDVRPVNSFSKLEFSTIGKIELIQSDHESLVIEANPEICQRVKTEVFNDTLSISMPGDFFNWLEVPLNNPDHIIFRLQMKNIAALNLSGAGKLTCDRLSGEALSLALSGPGAVKVMNAELQSLQVELSGVGSIHVSGKTETQTLSLSGAGGFNGENLESQKTQIRLSGVGNARVWSTQSLDVHISGAGGVEYFGRPQIAQKISGIGMLKYLGER